MEKTSNKKIISIPKKQIIPEPDYCAKDFVQESIDDIITEIPTTNTLINQDTIFDNIQGQQSVQNEYQIPPDDDTFEDFETKLKKMMVIEKICEIDTKLPTRNIDSVALKKTNRGIAKKTRV